jgi:hypothetical protein
VNHEGRLDASEFFNSLLMDKPSGLTQAEREMIVVAP